MKISNIIGIVSCIRHLLKIIHFHLTFPYRSNSQKVIEAPATQLG
jgi:hypothetical protein